MQLGGLKCFIASQKRCALGRDTDKDAMAALDHIWQKCFCYQHGSPQIDMITSVPFFDGQILDLTEHRNRRVVDDRVHFAKRHDGKVIQIFHARFITYISLYEEYAVFAEFFFQRMFSVSPVLMIDLSND